MKKPICSWQETMLDTGRNVHVSRCVCAESQWCFDAVTEARCLNCPSKTPPDDVLFDSIIETLDVKVEERLDEEVQLIYDKHCKKCPQYIEAEDICRSATCPCSAVVGDMIKSPHTHCPEGAW